MVVARDIDDLILDDLVDALQDFADAQAVEADDDSIGFTVTRDLVIAPAPNKMPLVNLALESTEPKQGSTSKLTMLETVRITADCYVSAKFDEDAEVETAAMARLYYLKAQVRAGLYRLANADFGQDAGKIGRKAWPRWTTYKPDASGELTIVGGQWQIEFDVQWTPEDIEGTPLEEISIDAQRWAALYEYLGD